MVLTALDQADFYTLQRLTFFKRMTVVHNHKHT